MFKLLSLFMVALAMVFQGCKKKNDDPQGNLPPITLECNYFTEDRVLEDDPNRPVDYIVPCVATVTGDVVIKSGVVIEFEDDAGLNVSTGSLKVEGTAAKKVVFTGVLKIKGSWRGIFFSSKSINNSFDHAVISYAGGNGFNSNNDRGNVICYQCKLSMTNTELTDGKEHGFNASYSTCELLAFENNTISGNDKYPVVSKTNLGGAFTGSNDFAGNGMDYIFLEDGQSIGSNQAWGETTVPYLIDGNLKINDDESLTLEAGTEVRFENNGEIDVASGGYLAIKGQPGNTVLLAGQLEQPGAWLGIINFSNDPRNVIDYAEIAHAGGGAHNSNGDLATIVVWSQAYQKVTNSILRDAASEADCAILGTSGTTQLETANNTVVNIQNEVCQ